MKQWDRWYRFSSKTKLVFKRLEKEIPAPVLFFRPFIFPSFLVMFNPLLHNFSLLPNVIIYLALFLLSRVWTLLFRCFYFKLVSLIFQTVHIHLSLFISQQLTVVAVPLVWVVVAVRLNITPVAKGSYFIATFTQEKVILWY